MAENYICKIANLEELKRKAEYEINRHPGNPLWVEFKEHAIKNFNQGNSILYIGILNNEIICEATAIIKEEGFVGDIDDPSNLLSNEQVYLSGFRTNKPFEGQGYFSKLLKFMECDLKNRGYKKMALGVEPCLVRNIQLYFHWGFTNYIKTIVEGNETQNVFIYYYKDI